MDGDSLPDGSKSTAYFGRSRRYIRRAWFTSRSLRKAAATSGSRSTTVLLLRYAFTYLPRTPPLKSYSARIGGSRRVDVDFRAAVGRLLAFFITLSFSTTGKPSADDSNLVVTLGVGDDENALPHGYTDANKSRFRSRMIRIWGRDR